MGDQGLRGVVSTLFFDPAAQTLQIAGLQQPQQRFLLLAPEMLRIRIVLAQKRFHLADLYAIVDPAFDLADPVNIRIVKQAVPAVRSLRLKQSIPSLPRP